MWKAGEQQFQHLATLTKFFKVVEGVCGAKLRLFCGIGVEVEEARVDKSGVKLLGFEKGK